MKYSNGHESVNKQGMEMVLCGFACHLTCKSIYAFKLVNLILFVCKFVPLIL